MKKIKDGVDIKTRRWEGNCHCCRAQFECTGEEIEKLRAGSMRASIARVKCPACEAVELYMEPAFEPPPELLENLKSSSDLMREFQAKAQEYPCRNVPRIEYVVSAFNCETGQLRQGSGWTIEEATEGIEA